MSEEQHFNKEEAWECAIDEEENSKVLCAREGCENKSIGKRAHWPGEPAEECCKDHDDAGNASRTRYEKDFHQRYGQYRSPWS